MPKFEVDNELANKAKRIKGKDVFETADEQAARILEYLKKQLEADANKKIGVIYAANNGQAEGLQASLNVANTMIPEGVIKGSGQAPVFAKLIKLINRDPVCRGRIKILPVSTSLTGGENAPGNIVSNQVIQRDLKAIQKQLKDGYDVFGMPSGQKQGYFAIGGKASKHWFTTAHAAFLYKGQLFSQGDFVQLQLNKLKQDSNVNLDAIFNEAKLLTGNQLVNAKAQLAGAKASSDKVAKPDVMAQEQKKKPEQPNIQPKPLQVDVEMMEFNNNALRAIADGLPPTHYLTPQQKEWWQAVEECQSSVKIYVSSKHESKIDLEQFAKLGHPGKGFNEFFEQAQHKPGQIISQQQISQLQKKGVFAPDAQHAAKDRGNTKYRIIVSDVPVLNADGTISKIKVMSTCAPNLMGTSGADKQEFLDANGNLDKQKYRDACTEIANLMAFAAKDSNIHPVKIAEFGLGVYLKNLPDGDKAAAREIMYSAFRTAAEKNQVQFDWLIWNDPAKDKSAIDKSVDRLNKNYFAGSKYISASAGNLISDVPEWTKNNPNVGEVNNGSDRTIGGAFTHFKPRTTEEQLAQAAFLAFVQTTLNSKLTKDVRIVNTDTAQQTKKNDNDAQKPPPQPQVQKVSPPPQPQVQKVSPPPQPQVQKVSPPPQPQVQKVSPPPQPQVQKASPPPQPQVQKASPPPQPQVQKASPPPQPQLNKAHQQPAANNQATVANSHQKMHLLMKVVSQKKLVPTEMLLAQNFKLDPKQIQKIKEKNGSIAMKVHFSDQAAGIQFSKQLALYGITSNTKPGQLKTLTDGDIYLTAKDLAQFKAQQNNLPTLIKATAINCLDVKGEQLAISRDKKNPEHSNLIMSFANKEEAELMSKRLFNMGVESNSNAGMPKSVNDNKIVLTVKDASIIQQHHLAVMKNITNLKDDLNNATSIKPSVNKSSGETNIIMSFANKEIAEQMSKQLAVMGIKSLSNPEMAKSVNKNNEIVLSQKQAELIHQQFSVIKHEKDFLHQHISTDVTIVPSIDKNTNRVNILAVFKDDKEAENFTKKLAEMGIESKSNPGQPKSVQQGHGVVLTPQDYSKFEQSLTTMRPSNSS